VWDFAAGTEQYDDLTLLSFRRAQLPAGSTSDPRSQA
jgi:hypothetical protein